MNPVFGCSKTLPKKALSLSGIGPDICAEKLEKNNRMGMIKCQITSRATDQGEDGGSSSTRTEKTAEITTVRVMWIGRERPLPSRASFFF